MLDSDTRRNYRRRQWFAQDKLLPEVHGTKSPYGVPHRSKLWWHSIHLPDRRTTNNLRALIRVQRDPRKVKIDGRPEHIGDPGAMVLFGFKEPLSILNQCRHTERRRICENSIKILRYLVEADVAPAAGDPG